MDSDYKLFDPKEEEKEDLKKKKKKEHSSGYYKFVNQFKNHLKKIENDFSGEEITQLPNHYNLISKFQNEFEEQRESCLNCYEALKEQISIIEKVVPNFDVNIFNTFFQNFEEYYSFFTKSQEILKTFSDYNDDTQNLFYILKRKNFCVEALKEFVDKISVDFADKIEQYDKLNEKFKNLMESYDKLYKIYQESKSSDLKQYDNIDNKELMIKKLNDKIYDLNIENDRIKKKYNESSNELQLLNLAIKVKYVLKSESEKIINDLKIKMNKYENDNIILLQNIKNIKRDNEKLIQEKESLEEQINSNLNNIPNYNDNDNRNNFNINDLLEEDKEKESQNSSKIENLQGGNDLGDFLVDVEENESEEQIQKENGQVKEIPEQTTMEEACISNISKEIKKNDNKNDEVADINNYVVNMKKTVSEDNKIDLRNSSKNAKKSNLRGAKKTYRHLGSVKIRSNNKISNNINSAYNVMFQGRQFQVPSRIASKRNFDYFKQFFFLLFQSMKMNSDKIGPFLGYDLETLYAQCRSEHIPFHKYQIWLEKQLFKKEQLKNEKRYEDFATITGIFCSSLL